MEFAGWECIALKWSICNHRAKNSEISKMKCKKVSCIFFLLDQTGDVFFIFLFMVTKKTPAQESQKEVCDTICCSCRGWFWWSFLRISLAIIIIYGAYIAWVICGTSRGDWDYWDHDGPRGTHMLKGEMNQKEYCQDHSKLLECKKYSMESISMPFSHDSMPMNMADMAAMLVGKTGDALDSAFIAGMIPHHQGAVDMAKMMAGSKHPELVKFANDIIAGQSWEIEQMQKWMQEWGYTSTGATSSGTMMNMTGMMMR